MFDKSTIEAYRQGKAPDALKKRVMEACSETNVYRKRFGLVPVAIAIAACMILIFSGVSMRMQHGVSVYFQGEKLSEEPVVLMQADNTDARESEVLSAGRSSSGNQGLIFRLETDKEMTLQTESGTMHIFSQDTDEMLFSGTKYTTTQTVIVDWYPKKDSDAELLLVSGKKQSVISLTYQEADNTWVVSQRKK